MKRWIAAIPLFLAALLFAAPLHAEVMNLTPVDNPLGDCYTASTPDECMASTTVTRCTRDFGCPQCGLNQQLNGAVCYVIQGNYGYCSCSAKGTMINKWGNLMPVCVTQGYCTAR